jgi:hypothetical protein
MAGGRRVNPPTTAIRATILPAVSTGTGMHPAVVWTAVHAGTGMVGRPVIPGAVVCVEMGVVVQPLVTGMGGHRTTVAAVVQSPATRLNVWPPASGPTGLVARSSSGTKRPTAGSSSEPTV